MMLTKTAGICGIISQFVGLATLLLSASNSPAFRWTENDISFLGVEGPTTALFNSGLIVTGLLGLVFAIGLGQSLPLHRPGRWGVVSLLLGSMALAAIGIFPRTISLPHNLASITFFIFIILALLLIGIAAINAAQTRWVVLSLTATALIIVFIIVPWPWPGGAIPQLLLCLPWSLWTTAFGVELLFRTRPASV